MMPMPQGAPQGAPAPGPGAPDAAAKPAPGGAPQGGAAQLVSGIHTQLMQLMDLASKSPAIAPEEKQELGSIITQYQDFVQNVLGSAPGAKPAPKAPQAPGSVPPEAGASPNAKPAM